jgi:hypothetical protein
LRVTRRYPLLQTPVAEQFALLYIFASDMKPGEFLTGRLRGS